MNTWIAILTAAAIVYALKLAGYLVPPAVLQGPRTTRVTDVLPAALLASLVVLQTFGAGAGLALDARAAGLVVAVLALLLRAPFLVVVVLSAATAALLRLAGWP